MNVKARHLGWTAGGIVTLLGTLHALILPGVLHEVASEREVAIERSQSVIRIEFTNQVTALKDLILRERDTAKAGIDRVEAQLRDIQSELRKR